MSILDTPLGRTAYDTAVAETKAWIIQEVEKYKEPDNVEYNRAIDDVVNMLKGFYKGQPA